VDVRDRTGLAPYQPATGSKSIDWPAARAVSRNGPLPTSVSGFVYQASSPAAEMTFWSMTQKGHRPTRLAK